MNGETDKKTVYSEEYNLKDHDEQTKKMAENIVRLEEENQLIQGTIARLQEEGAMLRELFDKASNELNNLKKPALLVSEVCNVMGKNAIIKLPNGNKFYCNISHDVKGLKSGDSVLVEQKSLNVVEKINLTQNFDVEKFVIIDKPHENWKDIGGLKDEMREIREVIELPLKKPQLFKKIGIQPPKGVLLFGPPGTGKTLLAKAVANSTKAMFIEVVGSELVQKFIGEGAKLVKDIFDYARKNAPAIVFIDEIDALAAMRMETGTSGEREVNRTFMQLLAELDGFDSLGDVKVVAATNRLDILDQAIIRPGRLDRLIEVNLQNEDGRLEILKVHTKGMSLKNIKLNELVLEMENFSGAEIKAVCTEAGYFAIRNNREYVTQEDFLAAIEKVRIEEEEDESMILG
ncbi:AAA family ATPase [Candidatus Woesearchaeota archaeon]|nr:AAA family ATPase [Candidatus Woesearchaeota archaeon]